MWGPIKPGQRLCFVAQCGASYYQPGEEEQMRSDKPRGKRQEMRAARRRRQRQQRLLVILVIVIAALGIVGMLIAPTIRQALNPVGEFAVITPTSRPMAEGTAMGDPNAPVRIDVFEDFQCIACVQFTMATEIQLTEQYVETGQVYYVFRHYPFLDGLGRFSNESQQAANASMCAAEQGRFWDYHDMLFTNFTGVNQGNFTDRRLIAFAEALGLNEESFESCFSENRYRDQIEADRAEADSLGVSGTPTVFVNGQRVGQPELVPTFAEIEAAILANINE